MAAKSRHRIIISPLTLETKGLFSLSLSLSLHISLVRAQIRRLPLVGWLVGMRAKTSWSRLITAAAAAFCLRSVGPTAAAASSSVLIMADKREDDDGRGGHILARFRQLTRTTGGQSAFPPPPQTPQNGNRESAC